MSTPQAAVEYGSCWGLVCADRNELVAVDDPAALGAAELGQRLGFASYRRRGSG